MITNKLPSDSPWLAGRRGDAPLILSIPHAGLGIPHDMAPKLKSLRLARKDADWWLPLLYSFAAELDATVIITKTSRTVIDVNRDPSGASLYPGQTTTGLCPTETFDGEPLYHEGMAPDEVEIEARKAAYFRPYHAAIAREIARLRENHQRVVLYDCHSIRSRIPRLFDGVLPNFNIGTNDGTSCDPAITARVEEICAAVPGYTHVVNGRFKGGYITRHYGDPAQGVHAIQMELACRGYMAEPAAMDDWPSPYDEVFAAPMRRVLKSVLAALLK